MKISTAYVGLGSNLQAPVQQLDKAVNVLRNTPTLTLLSVSAYYHSPAMLPDENQTPQPDYINAVAGIRTMLTPRKLLETLLVIETKQGRVRNGQRWAPRVLDLDLLLYDDVIIDEPDLQIPHPGLPQRAFVLYPLYDIAPELIIPGQGPLISLLKYSDQKALRKVAI